MSQEQQQHLAPHAAQQLLVGEPIAWTLTTWLGRTDGISSVHRYFEDGHAFCGAFVHDHPKRRFPILSSLHVCGECETLYAQYSATVDAESAA